MTVRELKEMLEKFDDDLLVVSKNDCGDYDDVTEVYEDTEQYWETIADMNARKPLKTRKVLKIYS